MRSILRKTTGAGMYWNIRLKADYMSVREKPLRISRACLKNAFCEMCFTVCGEFIPNLGVIVGYVD